jgi:hypothetical protein
VAKMTSPVYGSFELSSSYSCPIHSRLTAPDLLEVPVDLATNFASPGPAVPPAAQESMTTFTPWHAIEPSFNDTRSHPV